MPVVPRRRLLLAESLGVWTGGDEIRVLVGRHPAIDLLPERQVAAGEQVVAPDRLEGAGEEAVVFPVGGDLFVVTGGQKQ